MKEKSKKKINELIQKLLEKHPNTVTIQGSYHGSGDSFDEISSQALLNENGEEFDSTDATTILREIFLLVIDIDGRSDFNNEGCCGNIEIDIKTGKIKIEVEFYELVAQSDGENEYDNILSPKEPDEEV